MTDEFRKIWLIGDGRSGTTWVSNILNHHGSYRLLFEPFHPIKVPEMSFLSAHEYLHESVEHLRLEAAVRDVFSGTFNHPRVNQPRSRTQPLGVVVKDIFANLFSYWAYRNFLGIRPILLIRNPFAVAVSKLSKAQWSWSNNPSDLLNQNALFSDFLHEKEDLIGAVIAQKDPFLNQLLTWSILNYVPLTQFAEQELCVTFYEQVCLQPELELDRMQTFVGQHYDINLDDRLFDRVNKLNQTSNNMALEESALAKWRKELSVSQISSGLDVLDIMGLADLYADKLVPNIEAFKRLRMAN